MYLAELILLVYFSYVSLYSFVLAVGASFFRVKNLAPAAQKRKMAVLIPAYKEDQVIVGVAEQALNQRYPTDKYDVVVIADSLAPATLQRLSTLPIRVVEVFFETSTKVKALNKAMEVIGDDYDCAVILDADNVMEPDFLSKMNDHFAAGFVAVQGRRDPKNENNSMAFLDGLSETINNFIYRQGTVSLGMSSSLNGSGMAFAYSLYKDIMAGMDSIGGFDRELELKLLERNIKVYFAKQAVVYDEKVSNTEVFERQRKRWISSQFFYLRKYFVSGFRALVRGNFSYFNSAVLRNIQLPRVLNFGLLTLLTILSFVFSQYLRIHPGYWLAMWVLTVVSMLISIPGRFYSFKLVKSVVLVPRLFIKMFMLLFKLKGANKTFIHTPHGHIDPQTTNAEKV